MSDEMRLYLALCLAAEILDRRAGDLNGLGGMEEADLRELVDKAKGQLLGAFEDKGLAVQEDLR